MDSNEEQLYDRLAAKYHEDDPGTALSLSEDDLEGIVETVSGKINLDELDPATITVEDGPDQSYRITLEADLSGLRGDSETTLFYDPSGEYCVTWGNAGTDVPPEGTAYDGDGNELGGIR